MESLFWSISRCSLLCSSMVHLPHLLIHCWSDEPMESTRNALAKYIDWCVPHGTYVCAHICVEVDLDKFIESITLKIYNWTHVRQLNYEQLPFKTTRCHEYQHFTKDHKEGRCRTTIKISSISMETNVKGFTKQIAHKSSDV